MIKTLTCRACGKLMWRYASTVSDLLPDGVTVVYYHAMCWKGRPAQASRTR